MEKEIWKPIPGYDKWYDVSNKGQVRSWINNRRMYGRSETPKILKPSSTHDGYKQVVLLGNSRRVHRLVAKTFIPNPENKSEVNHKNCIKDDNRVENLEWVMREENMSHAFANGIFAHKKGEKSGNSKLSKKDVLEIRQLHLEGKYNGVELAKIFDVTQSTISSIVLRKSWKHLTGNQK